MSYKLSICIPTFNRAPFIGSTLESIVLQGRRDVEIVIMDGASTDNTAFVVQEYQNRFQNIRYYCGEKNMGVDADLAKAISLAKGDYCWLMSSDDILKVGAIDRVLEEIERRCGIYLCNRTECTKDMVPIKDQYWLPRKYNDQIFDFLNEDELSEYLGATNMIGALFSYIPCVIVSRQEWLSIEGAEEFFDTGYAHVYTLFSIIKKKRKLKYIDSSLVLCRMDNDSFSGNGLVNRYLLDFNGYLRIANKLFSDNETRDEFLKVITREHKWYRLLKLRSHVQNMGEWAKLEKLLIDIGYSPHILSLCGFWGRYRKLISLAVITKKFATRFL